MTIHLHYNTTGSGEPIIILHGLFGSSRNWQGMAGRLGHTHRVLTVDLRNHGQSHQAASMTYPEMAEDVLHLVKQQALEDVTLIGHSMGGKTAMTCALLQPNAIARLVVLDIAPVPYQHRYGKLFYAMHNLPLGKIRNRREAEQALNEMIDDIKLSRFLLQNLVRTASGYRWRINLETIQNNIKHISKFPLPSPHAVYDRPALFLGGGESHFLQPVHHPAIKAHFSAARIELIDRAGHMLHIEKPDIVLDRIRQFLPT
jgi:pimeloyl-ACP methyl ester carboxylesterase